MEASEYVIEIASTTGRRETLTDSSLPLQYDGGFWGIAPYRHVSIYCVLWIKSPVMDTFTDV
ncbi:hypothetical protein Mic7113_5658 [Allocoleopsis franciscana PCC 7113]|uniref:Uncharacterized protein n=1 Tax=Allocoleopsis franciscana PCC 7113 TaxID=1173027 RepID=K9WNA4_9CYAN|nr:hypothetical protein Mic7113_5658 [Allocoleopsis franciscana PCC 7113]